MTKKPASGNGPALPRRAFLAAAPAAVALGAIPTDAAPAAPDPVVLAYADWLDARRDWRALSDLPGTGNFDTADFREAEVREEAARLRMIEGTATSADGMAGLVALAWMYADTGATDPLERAEQLAKLENAPLLALWRACGREGEPEV